MLDDQLTVILDEHISRYPQMQVEDLYKLLHQAALGSEHAVTGETAARCRLLDEMQSMGEGPDEPLPDPIAPGGRMVRLHLRPWLQEGRNPEELLRLFLRTAADGRGSPRRLISFGKAAIKWSEQQSILVGSTELTAYLARMEAEGFPSMHHSQVFTTLYRPAYRVADRRFMEEA